jgi:hypothetical protein
MPALRAVLAAERGVRQGRIVDWFVLEPEVAGGWGENTVADMRTHPPIVSVLHYRFDGWLGDELVEAFPSFIVTRRVAQALLEAQLTGLTLAQLHQSTSTTFDELQPGRALPEFEWLQVAGSAGEDDIGLSSDHRLVVSARALSVLRTAQLGHCEVEPWP